MIFIFERGRFLPILYNNAMSMCTLGYIRVGCFGDTSDRAIPTLEGTDSRLDGSYTARTDAIEKCAEVTDSLGYNMFAVQNGGQCFSSSTAATTFGKYGVSSACKADGEGGPWANEVYMFTNNKGKSIYIITFLY